MLLSRLSSASISPIPSSSDVSGSPTIGPASTTPVSESDSSAVPMPVVTSKRRVKLSIDTMLPINIKPKVSYCVHSLLNSIIYRIA